LAYRQTCVASQECAQISFGKALYPTYNDSANRTASDQIAQSFGVDAKHARRFASGDKCAIGEGCGYGVGHDNSPKAPAALGSGGQVGVGA
jgi:hypothetical protein